jgi:Phage integrase, N-terminal SAM-like domain
MDEAGSAKFNSAQDGGRCHRLPIARGEQKLPKQLRQTLLHNHYGLHAGQTYVWRDNRFICFHNVRHPAEKGEPDINVFRPHLAFKKVSASTQNQAFSPMLCPYCIWKSDSFYGGIDYGW